MSSALLWLRGSMQSWGSDYNSWVRDTEAFPTLSGVLGMVCRALGRFDPDPEWLLEWRGKDFAVDAYVHDGIASGRAPGILVDYQTIGLAYDPQDPWEKLGIPRNGEGLSSSTARKMTNRYYLQDSAFACALEIPDGLVEEIVTGLKRPLHPVSLGRKCCVPSSPVFRGIFPCSASALERGALVAKDEKYRMVFSVRQGKLDNGRHVILNDVPLKFGFFPEYAPRWATVFEKA